MKRKRKQKPQHIDEVFRYSITWAVIGVILIALVLFFSLNDIKTFGDSDYYDYLCGSM